MVYQLPQTYPFACPQAKQKCLYERGLKMAWIHKIQQLTIITSTMFQATSNQL